MIIADVHEPLGLVERLKQVVPVEVQALQTADYLIVDKDGCTIGVERKAISDFLSSFGSTRLRTQLARLRRTYRPVLLIEGFYTVDADMHIRLGRAKTGWVHLPVQMALFAIQSAGIRIIWTTSHETTVDVLRGLHHRAGERCLVGLDEWGMEEDDGGGPTGGSDDLRLEPVTTFFVPPAPQAVRKRAASVPGPPSLAIKRG